MGKEKSELRALLDLAEGRGFEITGYKMMTEPRGRLLDVSMTLGEDAGLSAGETVSLFEANGYQMRHFGYSPAGAGGSPPEIEVMLGLPPEPRR